MPVQDILQPVVLQLIEEIYGSKPDSVEFQQTRKEFEGDITLVIFPFLRLSKKGPEQTAIEIGEALLPKAIWFQNLMP